jgi:hypothetical protein
LKAVVFVPQEPVCQFAAPPNPSGISNEGFAIELLGGGGGGVVTVRVTARVVVPTGETAVIVKVTVFTTVTDRVPVAVTKPIPWSIDVVDALVTSHERVVGEPALTVEELKANETMFGSTGDGGGGGAMTTGVTPTVTARVVVPVTLPAEIV